MSAEDSIKHDAESSSAHDDAKPPMADKGGAGIIAVSVSANIDPELAAAIAQISPERRIEIEKRLKLKLDFFLFPLLLAFYILNYLVSARTPPLVRGRWNFG